MFRRLIFHIKNNFDLYFRVFLFFFACIFIFINHFFPLTQPLSPELVSLMDECKLELELNCQVNDFVFQKIRQLHSSNMLIHLFLY